ncbi:MAG: DNA gyrase subunit A [Pseudomonadota bacterium]
MDQTTRKGIPVNIVKEVRTSYLDYAMSVIVGRALPDVRDGLKPVHRRVLFAMSELRNTWSTAYKKSARVVGDVIGKYHPHGDQAVYDTIVRMAQDFSMRYLLVDGQGNFGSVDGDPPAAMRYTEVRMERLASEMLADLEKETVDFGENYDGSLREPMVLPARFPNLLVNGSSGIAVGMATNIPPHNMREIIDATVHVALNPDCTILDLMRIVPGPDFPTAGFIYGRAGILSAYQVGRGVIKLRARVHMERSERTDRESIVVTELPYQVNKAKLLERMAELVKDKILTGISDLRDESDRDGMRMVIDLKKDAISDVVLNSLFAHTPMQSSFGINMLAIDQGQPKVLNLKQMLERFVDHRRDVVTRRSIFELRKAEERAHVLEGFKIALDNIDAIIELIRRSKDRVEAEIALQGQFEFSEIQAKAILDLRLHRLTGMERDKILEELEAVRAEISRLKQILADQVVMLNVIIGELREVRERFGDERRTEIVDDLGDIDILDLIAEEEMVVTISSTGYVKRTPISLYRSQRRGGRGKMGMTTKEEDFVVKLFVASTHDDLLIFTSVGKVYKLKVFQIPEAGRSARGRPIINLIPVVKGEIPKAIVRLRELKEGYSILTVTRKGYVKRTAQTDYTNIRSTGIIGLRLDEDDDLIRAREVRDDQEILLVTRQGMSIRFNVDDARQMGRATRGVRGVRLRKGDEVVGAEVLNEQETILSVSELGYGKRSSPEEYRIQNRGGTGIITIKTSERNGLVAGAIQVLDEDNVMLATDGGKIIRTRVNEIPVLSRNTQGVKLINLEKGERVIGLERLAEDDEEEDETEPFPAVDDSRFHSTPEGDDEPPEVA